MADFQQLQNSQSVPHDKVFSLLFIYYLLSLHKNKLFHIRFILFGTVFTSPFSNLSNIVNLNLAIAVNVIYQCIKGARAL